MFPTFFHNNWMLIAVSMKYVEDQNMDLLDQSPLA
jgi:hypothetical protein